MLSDRELEMAYERLEQVDLEIVDVFQQSIAERDKRIAALEVLLRDATEAKDQAIAAYRCETKDAALATKAMRDKLADRDKRIADLEKRMDELEHLREELMP